MSHELRTPLNVIMGYTEMLEDAATDDPAAALARIRNASRELLELIEATLDLNRLESGIDATRIEPVRLDALAVELAEELGAVPRPAAVQLAWSAIPAVTLATDRRKLRTVVKNLVGNALKFTAAGRVTVGAVCNGPTVVLTVTDTGIGIPTAEQPHIFDKFRQVDSSDRRSYGGVGLGLHIVQRLVDQLGGTIAVASEPGAGSTFTVILPRTGPSSTQRELHRLEGAGTMTDVAAEQDVAPRTGARRSP
jgi:signal transduction histidine kinase